MPGTTVTTVLVDAAAADRILAGASATDVNRVPNVKTGLFISEDRGKMFHEITHDLFPSDQVYWIEKAGRPDTYLFSLYSSAGGLYEFTVE